MNNDSTYMVVFEEEPLLSIYKWKFKRIFSYQKSVSIIENEGVVNIYTPELATILNTERLPVVPTEETPDITQINGRQYYPTYKKAFFEGVQYFNEKFTLYPEIIYDNEKSKIYLKRIEANLHEIKHEPFFKGWISVKQFYPKFINHEAIKRHGFYSGIISELEDLIKREPNFFGKKEETKESVNNRTKEFITDTFEAFEGRGKKGIDYFFVSEQEYSLLANLLVLFFEQKQYDLPFDTIRTRKRTKTKLGEILKIIHNELSEEILKSDKSYFDLIKVLEPFSKASHSEIYKALTK